MAGWGSRRRATEERERRFAAAYLKTEGNGVEAARLAGYRGTKASLAVTASRLLKRAKVRAILDAHGKELERRLGMDVEEILDRIATQARSSLAPFLRLITPEDARLAIQACGDDKDRAKHILAAIEGTGFCVDVEAGVRAGKGDHLKSVSLEQTAEGAPRVRIEVRDPMPALALLAKIRGLTNEQPPPPPRQSVTLNLVLASLPTPILDALNAALEAAAAKRRAIPAELRQ